MNGVTSPGSQRILLLLLRPTFMRFKMLHKRKMQRGDWTNNKQANKQTTRWDDGMTEGDSRPEARAPWGWGPQRAGPEPERIQSQRQIIKLGCLAPVALVRRFRPWPKTHPPTSQCPHPSSFRRYIRISWPLAPGCCILQHSTNEMSGWSGRVLII